MKQEWVKLRENYRKCCRRREKLQRSGAGNVKLPTCKFYSELIFLSDSFAGRSTTSNIIISPTPSTLDIDTSFVSSPPATNLASSPCSFSSPSSTSTTTSNKNLKRKQQNDDQMYQMYLMKKLEECDEKETIEEDADTLFCKSLIDIFRKLDPRKNQLAKLKVQQLLTHFEITYDE